MLFSSATGAGSSSALHSQNYAQAHFYALECIEKLQIAAKASPDEKALVELLRGYIALRQILRGLLKRTPEAVSPETSPNERLPSEEQATAIQSEAI